LLIALGLLFSPIAHAISLVERADTGGGAEINNLETITTDIETTEIPIGTDTDTVVYAALSGDVTMTNAGVVTVAGTHSGTAHHVEDHASRHAENGADEILGENLGTACAINQIWKSDGAGGMDCAADSTGSALGSNLTSTTDDILSDNGTMLFGGTGGSNNETIDSDYETTANLLPSVAPTTLTKIFLSRVIRAKPTSPSSTLSGAVSSAKYPLGETSSAAIPKAESSTAVGAAPPDAILTSNALPVIVANSPPSLNCTVNGIAVVTPKSLVPSLTLTGWRESKSAASTGEAANITATSKLKPCFNSFFIVFSFI